MITHANCLRLTPVPGVGGSIEAERLLFSLAGERDRCAGFQNDEEDRFRVI